MDKNLCIISKIILHYWNKQKLQNDSSIYRYLSTKYQINNLLIFFLAWIIDRTYSNSLHIKIYNIPKKYDSFSCKALRIWTLIGKEKR